MNDLRRLSSSGFSHSNHYSTVQLSFYVRLRDMSQETDQEHRKRISEMEKDVATVDKLEGLLASF